MFKNLENVAFVFSAVFVKIAENIGKGIHIQCGHSIAVDYNSMKPKYTF